MLSQHIIRLYEVIDTGKYVIIVMEYVAGGSLHGYLKAQPNKLLAETEAKRVFKQVVEGIRYCHNRCITHRDIKLENLLLDEQNNLKIIDFGFSTCIQRLQSQDFLRHSFLNGALDCQKDRVLWSAC